MSPKTMHGTGTIRSVPVTPDERVVYAPSPPSASTYAVPATDEAPRPKRRKR